LISKTKMDDRQLRVFDVFGMIPEPTIEDTDEVHTRYEVIKNGESAGLGDDVYYGYEENLYEKVKQNLRDFGVSTENDSVQLIKGLVQETLHPESAVAFAHIDVDWYDPVKVCVTRIWPRLSQGGCLVIDDYFVWGGCTKAVDEFLITIPGQYELVKKYKHLKIIKK